MSRKLQTSSARGSLAVPLKILNLSSRRARCGLRSGLGCGSFTCAFFSVAVMVVAIFLVPSTQYHVLSYFRVAVPSSQSQRSLGTEYQVLGTAFLAGRLGFEPRQSAPKALDLPLVDRPIRTVSSFRFPVSRENPRYLKLETIL